MLQRKILPLSSWLKFRRKREKYEDFLKSVKLLQNMDHYERSKLADAIKEERFAADDYIIKEVSNIKVFTCEWIRVKTVTYSIL